MTNKYLTKVCALLDPGFSKEAAEKKLKQNKFTAKIKKLNQKRKPHNGDTTYRTHKVYK